MQSDTQYELVSKENSQLKSAEIGFWRGHLGVTRLQNETVGEGMTLKKSNMQGIGGLQFI
jgi:hypothetical protein